MTKKMSICCNHPDQTMKNAFKGGNHSCGSDLNSGLYLNLMCPIL